jgi:hypothetical protein
MLGTRRPARIHERVMEILLNIIDNLLFELFRIVTEHAASSNRLLDRRLVVLPKSHEKVVAEQPDQTVRVRLRDGAFFFPATSDFIARCAVRDAVANLNVALAEHLSTDDA